MNGKVKNLLKDTLIFAIGNLGSRFILFFMVPLYTNFLTREEYGISDYVFTISQLIIPIVSISIWEGIVRIGLKKGVRKEDVLCNSLLVFGFSCAVVAITTPLWRFYAPIAEWRVHLSVFSLVYVLNQIEINYVKIQNKNKLFAIASILQTLILATLNILLLVKFRLGINGYLISNIIAVICADLFLAVAARMFTDVRQGHIRGKLLKSMLSYSAPLIINNISWWVIHSSDKIMIESMLGAGDLGLYTVSSKIPTLINAVVTVFTQAWGISSIREMESTNDEKYYAQVFEVYSTVLFFVMILFTLVLKPFMMVYVGKDFIDAWKYVPILFFAAVFQAVSAYFGSLLGALQKSVRTMTSTLVGSGLNIVVNYVFIRLLGIWGALIGTASAFVVITVLRIIFIKKDISFEFHLARFVVNSCICLCCAIAVSTAGNGLIVGGISLVCLTILNFRQLQHIAKLCYSIAHNAIIKIKKH